ncbi:DNA-binding transcriptional regulator CsgD [compost metagenome]
MNGKMAAVRKQLHKLGAASISSQQYRETVITQLREAVAFDAACFTAVDPSTLLSTGAISEDNVEAIHQQLFEYEYLHEDFNKYEWLALSADSVATLNAATEGLLERSGRYRNVLQPAGFEDELRAALMSDGSCWGYLTLFRTYGKPPFQEEERAFVSSISPLLAKALQKSTLALPKVDVNGMKEETGIMILSDLLIPVSFNSVARDWLTMLRAWEQVDNQTLPRPIRAVCSRALAEASFPDQQSTMAKICIRIPDGAYLSLQASRLEGPAGITQLAVTFQPARPSEILPLITEAYALSARERQIVDGIFHGLSTKELAESLHLSTYTVQDHLKSIFTKTAVKSRRELIWLLFSRYNHA